MISRVGIQQIVGRERRERVSHHNWSGDARFGIRAAASTQPLGIPIICSLEMGKLALAPLFVVMFASACLAQFTKFDCSVVTLNLDSSRPDVIKKKPVREIGRFKVDGVGEEERISKHFRLPNTKGFRVASLYSTDESLGSKSGPDSFEMELTLAQRRRRNIFTSPAYASSEAP